MANSVSYRADIDGARAIAVTLVTLFHLDIHMFAGGYIGVDVFFVISGFLITSIIWNRVDRGSFKLKDFYLGRIRRLLPALLVTILGTYIAASFILLPDDFARFARSAISSIFSVSNILFYFEAGYWDTSSHLKPLLHTWSLGVEEQFYLVWPLFVLLCATLLRRIPFILILFLVSLTSTLAMLWYSEQDISGAFYLFPFRIFQFALGALVAFGAGLSLFRAPLRSPIAADAIALLGMAIIIYSALAFGADTPFPGLNALVPTAGTMLVLYAGSGERGQGMISRILLANPVSVFLGKISYAAYLVHWPIIVLYRYQTGSEFTLIETLGLAAATIILAIILHYGVEKRFYRRADEQSGAPLNILPNGAFALRTLAVSIVMALTASHAVMTQGWLWRFPQIALTPSEIEAGKQARFSVSADACSIALIGKDNRCRPVDGDEIDVLFLGNSHEPDGFNFILSGYEASDPLQLIKFGTLNECSDLERDGDTWSSSSESCQSRLDALLDQSVIREIEVLVYSSYRPFVDEKELVFALIDQLHQINPDLKIVVFGGYIGLKEHCSLLLNKAGTSSACKASKNVEYFGADPSSYELYGRYNHLFDAYIDRIALHCTSRFVGSCETETENGVPFAVDEHHATFEFAEYGGQKYAEANPDFFKALLGEDYPETAINFSAIVYQLSKATDGLKPSAFVGVTETEQGIEIAPLSPLRENLTGGDTGGAHIIIRGAGERKLSGQTVQVRVIGETDAPAQIWMQYSTNDVGNSGWLKKEVDGGPFDISFTYNVAEMNRGGGDYIGFASPNETALIKDILVEVLD